MTDKDADKDKATIDIYRDLMTEAKMRLSAIWSATRGKITAPLKGKSQGFWAVTVSGNWRIVFRFEGEDAADVDLVDYH